MFNRNTILAFSVTASVIAYFTYHSSTTKQQQQRQLQHNDVLERVFALHANNEAAKEESSVTQNNKDVSGNGDSNSNTSRNLFNIIGAMGGDLEVEDNLGPWAHYQDYMTMYSSTPFNPRVYTGEDTEFLHYKDPTEQDEDGTTTFPPTRSPTGQPIQQNTNIGPGTAKPTEHPTRFPTSLPVTLEPTRFGETRHPTKEPTRFPTKFPTREPTKFPTREVSFIYWY